MALNQDVVDAVESTNEAVKGSGPAFYLNLALSDAVSHQRRMNVLVESAVAKLLKNIDAVAPPEALAAVNQLSQNTDISSQISKLAKTFSDLEGSITQQGVRKMDDLVQAAAGAIIDKVL